MRALKTWVMMGLAALLASCGLFTSNESTYRFKMTVEVETAEGLKSGSSVYEVGAGNKVKLTSEEGSRYLWTTGEAVAVDIAPGKTLFALLKTGAHFEDMATLSMDALDPLFKQHYDTVATAARISGGKTRRSAVVAAERVVADYENNKRIYRRLSNYPLLVTFRDINDPKTVERVEPGALDAVFGPGVKLRRITVAVTDEPVTTGIEKRLGWLPDVYTTLHGADFKPSGIPVGDFIGLFSTELSK